MASMRALRQARSFARLVLAWFALTLGVAVASPLLQPQSLQLVCTGSGAMQLVVKSGDSDAPAATHTLECPLCAAVAPPPPVVQAAAVARPSGPLLQPVEAARQAARPAAPLPARGPPAPSMA